MEMEAEHTTEIKRKMQFSGKVKKISLAGAVIDIGINQPAVLHISQLVQSEDQPVKRVEDVLEIGQEIDVWVKKVMDDHVELTMVKPLALEWREIKNGMTVKGTVTRIEKFGVFVEIGAERPGLIHISELAHGYVRTPSEIVKEGDEIEAQVLEVIRRKKQIKLSMKALQAKPEEILEEVNQEIEAEVSKSSRRKPKKNTENKEPVDASPQTEGSSTPEPTAMELALRDAMEKANVRKRRERSKKQDRMDEEQDEIIARTLRHKERSGNS
jgi:ribosomal protein S1